MVIGWMMGAQMDLNLQLFETATLLITVIVVAFFLQLVNLEANYETNVDFIFMIANHETMHS